jgi:anaerobic C4-dicarboxylate transporter DcuA
MIFLQLAVLLICIFIGARMSGIGLGVMGMIGIFPTVNGHFFVPGYPTLLTAIQFDRTGTTRIGKYVLNHSFMLPGLVTTFAAVVAGLALHFIIL